MTPKGVRKEVESALRRGVGSLPFSMRRIAERRHKTTQQVVDTSSKAAQNTAHAINRQLPDLKN